MRPAPAPGPWDRCLSCPQAEPSGRERGAPSPSAVNPPPLLSLLPRMGSETRSLVACFPQGSRGGALGPGEPLQAVNFLDNKMDENNLHGGSDLAASHSQAAMQGHLVRDRTF